MTELIFVTALEPAFAALVWVFTLVAMGVLRVSEQPHAAPTTQSPEPCWISAAGHERAENYVPGLIEH
jgi:hypothetical protein